MNKVKNFRRSKEKLPDNIARDKELNPTNNPFEASCLEPIGAHKGFALAFLVEILTSGLANQNHSINLMPMYGTNLKKERCVSHSFIILNPIFLGKDTLEALSSTVEKTINNVSLNQSSLIPGIKETLTKKRRKKEGIPVEISILKGWEELGFIND